MIAETTTANHFDDQAQRILTFLKSDIRYDLQAIPRPLMAEFTGSPSAGKTATITELDKFLRRQGFRVWRPQEGAEVIRHIPRTTPVYNVRTALYALCILLDESFGHKYDIIIFDRCIFDAYAWMDYWLTKGKITETEQVLIRSFFLSRFWSKHLDAAYFMVCDPEEAMRREMRVSLSDKMGETSNPETIKVLADRYRKAYTDLKDEHPQLTLIDTTTMKEQNMVESIATHLLNTFESKCRS